MVTIDLTGIRGSERISHPWWDVMRATFMRDGKVILAVRRTGKMLLDPPEEVVHFDDGSLYKFVGDGGSASVWCTLIDASPQPPASD